MGEDERTQPSQTVTEERTEPRSVQTKSNIPPASQLTIKNERFEKLKEDAARAEGEWLQALNGVGQDPDNHEARAKEGYLYSLWRHLRQYLVPNKD